LGFLADLAGLAGLQFFFLHLGIGHLASYRQVFQGGVIVLVVEEGLEGC
jgi:hypothetical protein